MIKLEFKNKKFIEQQHLTYFEQHIKSKFQGSVFDVYCNPANYDNEQFSNSGFSISTFQTKFELENRKFRDFIYEKYKTLAIGHPLELKGIEEEIGVKFPMIKDMLKTSPMLNGNLVTRLIKKTYKDYLNSLFGYEDFKTDDFYEYVKRMAKCNLKRNQYDSSVYTEIIKILIYNFPRQEDKILEVFNPTQPLSEVDCRAVFKQLNNIDLTLSNYKSKDINKEYSFQFNGEWNAYQFVLESGIRVCPYCNRQYITPIFSNTGRIRADLDHFLPKSKYPYFSMSLYNLVPACKQCNQGLKKAKEFSFEHVNPYEHNLADYFKFKVNIVTKEVSIENLKPSSKIEEHLGTFKFESMYNYHQNQVDELIHKRISYPDDYIGKLYEEQNEYFDSEEQLKQTIVGYISDEERLNDEAFLKFRRDIAEQLGFIYSPNSEKIEELKKIVKQSRS